MNAIISADTNFFELAWEELKKATQKARRRAMLADGVHLVSFAGEEMPAEWKQTKPIFIRHICAVDTMIGLNADAGDIDLMRKTIRQELSEAIPTGGKFSVQTRLLAEGLPYKPFDLNKPLSKEVERSTGANLDVRNPAYVVSVVVAQVDGRLVACMGANPVSQNLSDWAGGARRFKRDEGQVSRAEFKLLEAIEQFEIKLPEKGVAIDLGAAPGGWTRVLRQHSNEMMVLAIDPGDLHESLSEDWGIHHKRTTAEQYMRTLTPKSKFDVLVNDMRMDSWRSAQVMTSYARYLTPNGIGIMTIKLPQHFPEKVYKDAFTTLEQRYEILGARQLFHNRNEITVYMRPKQA